MSRKKSSEPYEVGYGKPPKACQFKPGQSGNPKGRPKKSKNSATLLNLELDQRIVIQENGKKRTITKREAMFKQLVNGAIAGNIHKTILVTKLSEQTAEPEPFVPNEQDQLELQEALEAANM
jgi:hypothetical protein